MILRRSRRPKIGGSLVVLCLSLACLSIAIILYLDVRSIQHEGCGDISGRAPWRLLNNGTGVEEAAKVLPLRPFYRQSFDQQCSALFGNDSDAIKTAKNQSKQFHHENNFELWQLFANCTDVRNRFFYPTQPLSEAEAEFPIAYAIVLYDRLSQFEIFINSIYQAQNVYCLHVDFKAHQVFRESVQRFASCFPNIYIDEQHYAIASSGLNMIRAYRSCFRLLTALPVEWKYVITLQANDFPLRTNWQIVKVLSIFDGMNDIELGAMPAIRTKYLYPIIRDEDGFLDFSLAGRSQNKEKSIEGLKLYKGSVSGAMTRDFVEFVLTSEKAGQMLRYIDKIRLGDELYFTTLNHDDNLTAPGGFPGHCLGKSSIREYITRLSIWDGKKEPNKCYGTFRHSVCVFGVGDLFHLKKRQHLFLNKFREQYDPFALRCMHELIYNRTYNLSVDEDFSLDFYRRNSKVTFKNWLRNERKLIGNGYVNFTLFPCSS